MAGDWIKMRTDLYRDPKISVMADVLMDEEGDLAGYVDQHCQRNMTVTRNVTRNACVGALLSVWGVMRHRGVRIGDDLVCMGVGLWVLDDIADMPGFGNAMESTGWVQENDQGLIFPRFFDEYNVEPDGKNKSKNAERQARYRDRKRLTFTPESNVTSNVTHNVTVTPRIEESREEKSVLENPLNPPKGGESADFPGVHQKPKTTEPPQDKKPKRKPKETVGEFLVPPRLDSSEIREALEAFERMRVDIGHRIKDRSRLCLGWDKAYRDKTHLLDCIQYAIANEYQGIKPRYIEPERSLATGKPIKRESDLPKVDSNWEPA